MINRDYAIFNMISHRYLEHAVVQMKSIADLFSETNNIVLTYYLLFNSDETNLQDPLFNKAISYMEDRGVKVHLNPINREQFNKYPTVQKMKSTEFNKRARYFGILDILQEKSLNRSQYDAICFLDADMFIVSKQFFQLFDMVNSTDLFIVCNEKFKWDADKYFTNSVDGRNYLIESGRMLHKKLYKMHCNVPLFFAPNTNNRWEEIFSCYLFFADQLMQEKNNRVVGVGDIFCWNLACHFEGAFNKIISFPMETMTQVHQTNLKLYTRINEDNGYWYTEAGDQVFSIHGRVNEPGFVPGGVKRFIDSGGKEKDAGKIAESLIKIQKIWLNHLQGVKNYEG